MDITLFYRLKKGEKIDEEALWINWKQNVNSQYFFLLQIHIIFTVVYFNYMVIEHLLLDLFNENHFSVHELVIRTCVHFGHSMS